MKRHKRHAAVEVDLREAAEWYEDAVPGLGNELVDAVEAAIAAILDKPRAWSRVPGVPEDLDIRRYVLERFPYHVPYLLDGQGEVFILAVAHGKRRPRFWLRRTPSGGPAGSRTR